LLGSAAKAAGPPV